MKELKKFVIGTLVDGACIGAMVMQVMHPATYWDFWGSAGYFFQCVFIWLGLLFAPILLLAMRVARDFRPPYTEPEAKLIAGLSILHNNSVFYRRALMMRELTFCLIFSGMGWIWLALGNLLTLFLMHLVLSSPKVQVAQEA